MKGCASYKYTVELYSVFFQRKRSKIFRSKAYFEKNLQIQFSMKNKAKNYDIRAWNIDIKIYLNSKWIKAKTNVYHVGRADTT
jgi:hypothetical protein